MRTCITVALLFGTLLVGFGECQDSKMLKIGEIEWHLDYDIAMKAAKEQNRPLWLHFGEHPG